MKYCSLGNNCTSSLLLKNFGLKTESYPFDWLISKSEVVKLCIEDDFKTFLDRTLYSERVNPWDNDNLCQHDTYAPFLVTTSSTDEQIFFRHRDPLSIDKDYEYFIRCVERFRTLLASTEEKIFVKAYMDKDLESSFLEDALSLTEFLESHTSNYRMIAIKHTTTGSQSLKVEHRKNLIYADITSINRTDGAMFTNHTDQSFLASLFKYLINSTNEIR